MRDFKSYHVWQTLMVWPLIQSIIVASIDFKFNTKNYLLDLWTLINVFLFSPHFKVYSVSALLCKNRKKHAKAGTSRHLPVRASTWVVMRYDNALQFSKREGHTEQEHVHPSSLKHWLFRVRQFEMFTLPLFELEGHHNLTKTKTKTWIKHLQNWSKLRNTGRWKQAHRQCVSPSQWFQLLFCGLFAHSKGSCTWHMDGCPPTESSYAVDTGIAMDAMDSL